MLKKAEGMGFGLNLAFEYEFFLFNETSQSRTREKLSKLEPYTPGMCGYSIVRSSVESDLFNDFFEYCTAMNLPIEGLHCESGPGVLEAALKYDEALSATDKATLFKTFTKVFFQNAHDANLYVSLEC